MQLAAQDMGQFLFDRDAESPAYVLQFRSGGKIYSLSSNPNALAGKRGHVKLDEFPNAKTVTCASSAIF